MAASQVVEVAVPQAGGSGGAGDPLHAELTGEIIGAFPRGWPAIAAAARCPVTVPTIQRAAERREAMPSRREASRRRSSGSPVPDGSGVRSSAGVL